MKTCKGRHVIHKFQIQQEFRERLNFRSGKEYKPQMGESRKKSVGLD